MDKIKQQTALNETCILALKEIGLSDYFVVVGSGPSSPYIAPSSSLQDKLLSDCGIQKIEDEYFWKLAQRAYNQDVDAYHQVIKDLYGVTPYWDSRTYKHIAAISFKGYITFNYDDQLPRACEEAMGDIFNNAFSVYPPMEGMRFKGATSMIANPPQLACIHGYFDESNPKWHEEIILKEQDYDHHYTSTSTNHLFEFWSNMLTNANCLFIGTSLEEPGLFKIFECLKEEQSEVFRQRRHVLLNPVKVNEHSKTYPQAGLKFGSVEELNFDPIDSRYTGLINILAHFSGISTNSPRPRVAAVSPINETSNFNFYE